MSKEKLEIGGVVSNKTTVFYSFAGIADTMGYQMFTFYIFNFYFAVMGLNIWLVTLGYILWSIWNAINDPLLGIISDRTSSKWGRRRPYIIGGLIPTCILIVLLWTPPAGSSIITFIYFLIVINLFDTFYTMYSLNQTSLFPEMFVNLEQRTKANNYVQVFNIIGLLFAALLPSFFITEFLGPGAQMEYITAAIFMAILAAIFGFIFIIFGLKERKEYSSDPKKAPSFVKSLKFTFKNKAFSTYILTNFAQWYVFGLIPIINPYFLGYVIGITDAMIQSLFLAIVFISAIVFMVIWRNYFAKHGVKRGQLTALGALILTLMPFLIVWEVVGAIIAYILVGFGFAGVMFGRDVMMGAIIDNDEMTTGVRREGGYYGINALVIRFSTIAVSLSIALVFNNIGWKIYDPTSVTEATLIGIRLLACVFPAVAIGIGMLLLLRFPITKEKYEEIKETLNKLHDEKKEKVRKLN
ncbi:MAG: MFS transporter [Promethearchaeota archaeon]